MKAKAQQESLAKWAIQDTGKWKAWMEAEQLQLLKKAQIAAEQLKLLNEAKRQQREAWAKQLTEATEAEQQEREMREWPNNLASLQVQRRRQSQYTHRCPRKENQQQRDMMARNRQPTGEIESRNHQQKGHGQGTTSTKGQEEQWRQGTISSR